MATQTIERPVARPTPDLAAMFPGRYLSVTTFKRDGTGVATPVWFVADGEQLLALTDLHSGKVKRLRRNPQVLLASCRPGGRLRREPVAGRAEVLTSGPDLDRVQELLRRRYRVSYPLAMRVRGLVRRLRGRHEVGEGAALAITVE